MQHVYFFYFLLTFSIGIVSSGIAMTFYIKTKDALIRCYLYFYTAFTLIVVLNALLAYISVNIPTRNVYLVDSLDYLESSVAFFLVMFTFPVFMHRLVSVPHAKRRNVIIGGITLLTYLGLHFLAYVVREPSRELEMFGEYLRNSIFLSVMIYGTLIGITHYKHIQEPARRRLSRNFLILLGIFLPGVFHDTVLWEFSPIRFYPLLYCLVSVMFIRYFLRQYQVSIPRTTESIAETIQPEPVPANTRSAPIEEDTPLEAVPANAAPENAFFAQYNISPREKEIITLILRGYSYQKIGETLFISLNTVKTHIRNIYPKFGVKSRYELMTLLTNFPNDRADRED